MSELQHTPRVLIFDSGVGSLSIGAAIHDLLPELELLYVMDHGGFPYGEWQETALIEHICAEVCAVLVFQPADILVMACNSASTAVLPALRAQLNIPVVGVVPAIKPAAALSNSRVIGLLATPGTVSRPYTSQLINDFAGHCHIIKVGSKALAPAVEALFWHGQPIDDIVAELAQEFRHHPRAAEMDTMVLACTHFPLIHEQLASHLPGLQWVDSGQAIARRVAFLLDELQLPRLTAKPAKQQVLILGEEQASKGLQTLLEERQIQLIDA